MFGDNLLIFADFVRKLFKGRYMLWMLTLRELKARYAGSVFGFAWAVLQPLFLVAVYGVVFGVFFRSAVDPAYGADSYLLFLLCGLVPWQFFAETISSSAGIITANSSLVKKSIGFPSEVLPVTVVASKAIGHLVTLALLFVLLLALHGVPGPAALLILVYMFFVSLFAVGLGWILSSANVFLRDIQQALGLLMMGWFFMTPIIYAPSFVPDGWLFLLLKLNPMYHAVEGYRLALLAGKALPLMDLAYLGAASLATFGAGGVFFRKLKPWFAEVL